MPRIERDRELARRRHRKQKIPKLIERYIKAMTPEVREVIAAKIRRLSPLYDIEARIQELKDSKRPQAGKSGDASASKRKPKPPK
ncbi:MAG: hypothetical protein KatS3mg114_0571 [Planctomycetaceae bacterium]|nr:MAG: hypothetical protein KatS3mg114_0571 [Planctomycetaceae bacterium]